MAVPTQQSSTSVRTANTTPFNVTAKPTNGGAPLLTPNGTGNFDVHGTFPWALNATPNLRKYVPKIVLTEYKVTSSAAARALKLMLAQGSESPLARASVGGAIGSTVGGAIGVAAGAGGATAGAAAGAAVGALFGGVGAIPGAIIGGIIGGVGSSIGGQVVGGAVGAAAGALGPNYGDLTGFTNDSPYYGLYEGKPTGFTYDIPYLNVDSNMATMNGKWAAVTGEESSRLLATGGKALGGQLGGSLGSLIGGLAGGAAAKTFNDAASIGAADLAFRNPGVSKESVKAYSPVDEGEKIKVSFYLYNTENVADIKKNWDFLFTLSYQNLPNRRSLNLMDPPSLYSVEVPNFKYFPAAVISSVQVANVGTTRMVDITTGEIVPTYAGNNSSVKIIPEAYLVTIDIQCLIMNSRNLFYYINDASVNNKITVIEKSTSTG